MAELFTVATPYLECSENFVLQSTPTSNAFQADLLTNRSVVHGLSTMFNSADAGDQINMPEHMVPQMRALTLILQAPDTLSLQALKTNFSSLQMPIVNSEATGTFYATNVLWRPYTGTKGTSNYIGEARFILDTPLTSVGRVAVAPYTIQATNGTPIPEGKTFMAMGLADSRPPVSVTTWPWAPLEDGKAWPWINLEGVTVSDCDVVAQSLPSSSPSRLRTATAAIVLPNSTKTGTLAKLNLYSSLTCAKNKNFTSNLTVDGAAYYGLVATCAANTPSTGISQLTFSFPSASPPSIKPGSTIKVTSVFNNGLVVSGSQPGALAYKACGVASSGSLGGTRPVGRASATNPMAYDPLSPGCRFSDGSALWYADTVGNGEVLRYSNLCAKDGTSQCLAGDFLPSKHFTIRTGNPQNQTYQAQLPLAQTPVTTVNDQDIGRKHCTSDSSEACPTGYGCCYGPGQTQGKCYDYDSEGCFLHNGEPSIQPVKNYLPETPVNSSAAYFSTFLFSPDATDNQCVKTSDPSQPTYCFTCPRDGKGGTDPKDCWTYVLNNWDNNSGSANAPLCPQGTYAVNAKGTSIQKESGYKESVYSGTLECRGITQCASNLDCIKPNSTGTPGICEPTTRTCSCSNDSQCPGAMTCGSTGICEFGCTKGYTNFGGSCARLAPLSSDLMGAGGAPFLGDFKNICNMKNLESKTVPNTYTYSPFDNFGMYTVAQCGSNTDSQDWKNLEAIAKARGWDVSCVGAAAGNGGSTWCGQNVNCVLKFSSSAGVREPGIGDWYFPSTPGSQLPTILEEEPSASMTQCADGVCAQEDIYFDLGTCYNKTDSTPALPGNEFSDYYTFSSPTFRKLTVGPPYINSKVLPSNLADFDVAPGTYATCPNGYESWHEDPAKWAPYPPSWGCMKKCLDDSDCATVPSCTNFNTGAGLGKDPWQVNSHATCEKGYCLGQPQSAYACMYASNPFFDW
jgi:hypothetical protein